MSEKEKFDQFLNLYNKKINSFIKKYQPEKIDEFNKDIEKINNKINNLPKEYSICFLGNSGVGKSTLINCLVDGRYSVLPSGGIGPLTAQALEVKFGQDASFSVEYHSPQRFNQLIFGFEQSHQAEIRAKQSTFTSVMQGILDFPKSLFASQTSPGKDDPDSNETNVEIKEETKKSLQLMISGKQNDDLEIVYILDCLHQIMRRSRKMGTEVRPEDLPRIERIREALEFARKGDKVVFKKEENNSKKFFEELEYHASGFLAPLIKNITVYWPSEHLQKGLVLVDLPGVGIAGDVYRDLTRKWIREKAQAIVLVVDNRGITESVAQLLKTSEFLTRLIHTADEPDEDPVLLVAVTKIDDIASSEREKEKQKLMGTEQKPKSLKEHFVQACDRSREMIKGQIRQQLESLNSQDEELRATQNKVIDNLLKNISIFPVTSPEYKKLIEQDDENRSFLVDIKQSNIPEMQNHLSKLADEKIQRSLRKIDDNFNQICKRIKNTIHYLVEKYTNNLQNVVDAEKIRSELDIFIRPRRETLANHQGEYRGYLQTHAPREIADLVDLALEKAEKEIKYYLSKTLKTMHWKTLQATVRNSGVFSRKYDVHIPQEFASRIEEPLADAWGKKILAGIRDQTSLYSKRCLKLVQETLDWAKSKGNKVKIELVQAQFDLIQSDLQKINSVGQEMVSDLREKVKNQLIEIIEKPIGEECDKFVQRKEDGGIGVKDRIVDHFQILSHSILKAVNPNVKQILSHLFAGVRSEIIDVFNKHQDPLKEITDSILETSKIGESPESIQIKKDVAMESQSILNEFPLVAG